MTGEKEIHVIEAYRSGRWTGADDMPVCSTSEHICVALAIDRADLSPSGWSDPLDAYVLRLDDRQKRIVRRYRWGIEGR